MFGVCIEGHAIVLEIGVSVCVSSCVGSFCHSSAKVTERAHIHMFILHLPN